MHNSIQIENIQLAHLDIKCSFVWLNFKFRIIQITCFYCVFASLDLLLYNKKNPKKTKEFLMFIEENKKIQHMIKFLSSKQHTRVLLFCATATFMLFHYFFIFEIVNNFEISCQDNEFRLKVGFTL